MKSRRELAQEQFNLVQDIRYKLDLNIVTCGNCGTVLLHKSDVENIHCYECNEQMEPCHCPDLWYDSDINNYDEPIKEESKVIWPKGTIIEWNESVKYYNAKGGARARVTEDYTTLCETVKVEFLDDLSNGQKNGGYFGYMFKDEPIKETPPTSQCGNQDTFDKVKEVIQILKTLDNGDCVDGETMQYILEQVGMEEQMLKQLVMENDYKVTKDLMREKFELDL